MNKVEVFPRRTLLARTALDVIELEAGANAMQDEAPTASVMIEMVNFMLKD